MEAGAELEEFLGLLGRRPLVLPTIITSPPPHPAHSSALFIGRYLEAWLQDPGSGEGSGDQGQGQWVLLPPCLGWGPSSSTPPTIFRWLCSSSPLPPAFSVWSQPPFSPSLPLLCVFSHPLLSLPSPPSALGTQWGEILCCPLSQDTSHPGPHKPQVNAIPKMATPPSP